MKKQTQQGFIPLIIALIAALSIGGGVLAYKTHEHNKQLQQQKQQDENQSNLSLTDSSKGGIKDNQKSEAKSSSEKTNNTTLSVRPRNGESDDEGDDDDNGNVKPNPLPPVSNPGSGGVTTSYTLAEVKLHNTSSNCWTAVNGSVYNVTSFISQHPGGASAIISLCGIDGSAAFNGQHGGQSRPASELASFKIGVLK